MRAHHDASNISDGGPVARLKDRSLPRSCEGSHQLESRIDLFSLNVLFSDQAMPEIYILCRINYAYICTWMHANAREEERSGVRVQTESGTGERDTPHGRVKPTCLARKYRPCQRFAPCKTDFEKSTTVLQSKRSIDKIQGFERNFILTSFHWNGMECERFMNCLQSPSYRV